MHSVMKLVEFADVLGLPFFMGAIWHIRYKRKRAAAPPTGTARLSPGLTASLLTIAAFCFFGLVMEVAVWFDRGIDWDRDWPPFAILSGTTAALLSTAWVVERLRVRVWGEWAERRGLFRTVNFPLEKTVGIWKGAVGGDGDVVSVRIQGRDKTRVAWHESAFPQRFMNTAAYYAIRNHVENGTKPRRGWVLSVERIPKLSTDPMDMSDGTRQEWNGQEVTLDVIALQRDAEPIEATLTGSLGSVRNQYREFVKTLGPLVTNVGVRERWSATSQ